MKKKVLATVLCASMVAASLVGCGSAASTTTDTATTTPAATETQSTEETAAADTATDTAAKAYNIGYSNMQMKEDFFITVENGIYTNCMNKGYTYNTTISDRDSTKIVQNIDALIVKGADMIIDFDVLPEQGSAIGEDLKKQGIPMMSIDSDYGDQVYFFGVNNYDAGTQLGQALETFVASKFEDQVDYVVALWDSQSGDTVKARCGGAVDELQAKYGLSDDQLVWIDSLADDTKTQTMTKDWLDSHPDAKHVVFVGQNDDRGYAINQAVIAADRVADCLIGSHNADPSAVENLQKYKDDPTATAWVTTVSYNSYLYGEQIVQYATDILDGTATDEMKRYAETSLLNTENVDDYVTNRDAVTAGFISH